jgi:hypothetical protein
VFASLNRNLALGDHVFTVTADLATNAVGGRDIGVLAMNSNSYVVSTSSKSVGITTDGGLQTLQNLPDVLTGIATNMTVSTVELSGEVTADGGSSITNRGFVFDVAPGVSIADEMVLGGSGTGTFSAVVTNLEVNTRYYYAAFAQNLSGARLGAESNFWTLANVPVAPVVEGVGPDTVTLSLAEDGNPTNTEYALRIDSNLFVTATGGTSASA